MQSPLESGFCGGTSAGRDVTLLLSSHCPPQKLPLQIPSSSELRGTITGHEGLRNIDYIQPRPPDRKGQLLNERANPDKARVYNTDFFVIPNGRIIQDHAIALKVLRDVTNNILRETLARRHQDLLENQDIEKGLKGLASVGVVLGQIRLNLQDLYSGPGPYQARRRRVGK